VQAANDIGLINQNLAKKQAEAPNGDYNQGKKWKEYNAR